MQDIQNITPARRQIRDDTCGLYAAWNAIEDIDARPPKFVIPAELRRTIRAQGGVNEQQLQRYLNSLDDSLWALEKLNVTEADMHQMLQRSDTAVIAHVDGDHWVRVVKSFVEDGQEWVRVYDSGVGSYYDQPMTSFMARMTASNAAVLVGK